MSGANIIELKADTKRRMDGAQEVLHNEFAGLRTGRASIHLLDTVMVNAYGNATPLNQVGTVGVPESRMLTVQVWDRSLVGSVEKGILEAGLGLNPATDGQMVRIPIPPLTEERRIELTKIASKYGEDARISVRHVRKHSMDTLKKSEKDGDLSEDESRDYQKQIQDMTDEYIGKIDSNLETKEQEIMQV